MCSLPSTDPVRRQVRASCPGWAGFSRRVRLQWERSLKAVADASTIAGTDMGSRGAIFNKVAVSNKVQMDTINQLHDAGVPALQLLATEMGVTAEEASEMASRGEIDFATFQSAMESGMGAAALESGNTFSGAMDNVMASLGRVGADLLSGIFPDMKDGLKGLIDAMVPLEDLAKYVGAAIGEFVGFRKNDISWIGPLATGIGIAVGALIALNVIMWILSINPGPSPHRRGCSRSCPGKNVRLVSVRGCRGAQQLDLRGAVW